MTPTPTELLAAATRLSLRSWTPIDADESVLADHILANVRADDDEPITLESFQAKLLGVTIEAEGCELMIDGAKGGHIFASQVNGNQIRFTMYAPYENRSTAILFDPTWGQFRSLCRALGLTLPEVQG